MKNKLFIFGDSNSIPFFGNSIEYKKYLEFKKGNKPKGWSELLSNKLNLEEINYGEAGSSNETIFQTICNHITEIKPNDYVLVGWTFKMRYQVVSSYDDNFQSFSNVLPSFLPDETKLSNESMNEFLLHYDLPFWVNKIYTWDKILIHLSNIGNFNLFLWSFDKEIGMLYKDNCRLDRYLGKTDLEEYYRSKSYKKLNTGISEDLNFEDDGFWKHMELFGMKQIWDETDGIVDDGHMSELGHIILADLFYYQILNKIKSE